MAIKLSDYDPAVKQGAVIDAKEDITVVDDLTVSDDLTVTGLATVGETLGVTGATTLSSTLAVTGTLTQTGDASFTGATNGLKSTVTVGTDATYTLTAAESGGTWFATATSGTQTYTLPAVAAGLMYSFVCGHANGEILIDQAASEVITITTFAAVGADADTAIVAPAGGTGIKNTAASNAVGDCITLISDGTGWYSLGITCGIWASQ